MQEYTYRAIKAYRERQKSKGIRYRSFMLSDAENTIIKAFIQCLRNINADSVVAIDVSDDGLVFKIIIEDKA